MTMDILPAATPAKSTAAATAPAADAPDATAGDALPWVAALQAALAHAKSGKSLPGHGKDADDPLDTAAKPASADDDKTQIPDAALTAAQAGAQPLLIPALPPAPPASALAPSAPAKGGAPRDGNALSVTAGATDAHPHAATERPASEHKGAVTVQGAAADGAAGPDAITRMIEHAAAREGNKEAAAQAPLSLAHAAPPAVSAPAQPAAAQAQIHAAVGAPQWGTEVGQKVAWMIGAKEHVAELRLNPPELGPLDIKLTVNSHETTAVFTSPHGAVRDAVESALPRLREVLAESGIMLGNASVTSDGPRDGSAFAAPQGQGQRGEFSGRNPAAASGPAQPAAASVVRRNGLVDLFA